MNDYLARIDVALDEMAQRERAFGQSGIADAYHNAQTLIRVAVEQGFANAHAEGVTEANAVRDRNFGNLRWMDGYEYGLDDGRFEVKRAVEDWFTDISLDDLYAVKGWSTHKVGNDGLTDAQRQESLDNFQRNVGHKPQRRTP